MGKVVAAHGIQGWVKVLTYTEYLDSLSDYDSWWLGSDRQPWRQFELQDSGINGKVLIGKLAGCDDRTAAERLKGLLVAVPRSELPPAEADEYYWSELIGMQVVNLAGVALGTVESLLETGSNDVLVLKTESGELLVPFIESVVQQVDAAQRLIRVDWQADYLA